MYESTYSAFTGNGVTLLSFSFSGCGVVHIWGLLRHGTRLGSRKYGMSTRFIPRIKNEIIENHEIHKR